MKTPQQAATNWEQSSGRAASNWTAGVNNYTGDWAQATIAQQGALLTNVTTAISNGSWAAGVRNTGTQGWKQATQASSSNYTNGFAKGAANQAAAIAKILQAEQTIVSSAPPRGTYEQNKARSTYVMDQLHALKGQLGA